MGLRSALFLLLVIYSSACAKVTVRHVTPPASPPALREEGVFYALPKTVARIHLKVDKTSKAPAPFGMFAPIFAPAGKALCDSPDKCRAATPTTAYAVQQGATFTTSGEPDPDNIYLVKFSGRGPIDQQISMAWTETGLPSTAAAAVTNRSLDVAVAGVKLAATIGSKAFLGARDEDVVKGREATSKEPEKPPTCPTLSAAERESTNDAWILSVLKDVADADARSLASANYCNMSPQNRDEYDKGTDEGPLGRAVRAFNLRVVAYINARHNLLTTGANVLDPAAMVDKLETVIDAEMKSLFLGTAERATWEAAFEVRDLDPNRAVPVVLLELDAANGPCIRAPLAVESKPQPPGFVDPKALDCDAAHTPVALLLAYHPAKSGQLFEAVKARVASPGTRDERSFRYRIPAQVRATVKAGRTEYGSGVFSVAQLGHVVSLPARRSSKGISYDLAFIEATGGLKTFKLGTTGALDAGAIGGLSDAGATVLNARAAARKEEEAERKAAATAADELTLTTRQHTLLKMKHEICEIQKKYGLACTLEP